MSINKNNRLLALSVGEKANKSLEYTKNNITVGGIDYITFTTVEELENCIKNGDYLSIITIFDCEESQLHQTNVEIAKTIANFDLMQISLALNEELTADSKQVNELIALCKNSIVVDGAAIVNICDYTNGHNGDATVEGYIYRFIYLVYGSVAINSSINIDFADISGTINGNEIMGFAALDGKGEEVVNQFLGLLEIVRFSKTIETNDEISVIATIETANEKMKMADVYKILGSINTKFGDNCNIIWSFKDNTDYLDTLSVSMLVTK